MASSLKIQGIGDATSKTESHDIISCSCAAHKQLGLLSRWAMLPSLRAGVSSSASLHLLGGSVQLGAAQISSRFCPFHFCNTPVECHNCNQYCIILLEFSGDVISNYLRSTPEFTCEITPTHEMLQETSMAHTTHPTPTSGSSEKQK